MEGILYLEDGTIYKGKGFGAVGTSVGELVFNTSMTGYEEILTDPSYKGQIVTMTYPIIGNYGVNNLENQSNKIHAKGFVVKSISKNPSNYMSKYDIDKMLKEMNIVGIHNIDTRSVTKKIRSSGVLKCVVSNEGLATDKLKEHIENYEVQDDWMKSVGVEKSYNIPGAGPKIALLDFGVKKNIINNLIKRGCDVTVFPYNTSYEEIMNINPKGVLLSNGPGDPALATEAIKVTKKIMNKLPIFGICLGHQILGLALGGSAYKMKYGHRGGNHGVYDIEKDRAYITAQNHGYCLDDKSIVDKGMIITHKNLNDNTVEGMKHKELPVFSIQFHPEGSPGPEDYSYLFNKFVNLAKEEDLCH